MKLFSSHGDMARRLEAHGPTDFTPTDAHDERVLHDLKRLGFVRQPGAGRSWCWDGTHPTDDRALLMLLARFDLDLEVGPAPDDLVWIALAIAPSSGGEGARDAFSGTGPSPADAVRACLGEFAETQSWLFRPNEPVKRCDRDVLGAAALDPWHVLGFASGQREQRLALNRDWQGYDSIPEPAAFDGWIDWSRVEALSGGPARWLPSQICFGRYAERAGMTGSAWRSDSNGCAAGRTSRGALSRALLELIERDATGIWWYGTVPRSAVAPSAIEGDVLAEAVERRAQMGQQARLLDLTHDLDIPVVAAILLDREGSLLALGFGCDEELLGAARSAYREMCQMELSVALTRRRAAQADGTARPEDRRLLDWLAAATLDRLPHLRPADGPRPRMRSGDTHGAEDIVERVLERLQRAGLEAFFVDLQRDDIGIPAVRAFVPGLCHFKPRLGHRRLVDAPRALGWRDPGFAAADLAVLPLLM
jgi:ribosomal protein S12 methylthiotransferase accessory factor